MLYTALSKSLSQQSVCYQQQVTFLHRLCELSDSVTPALGTQHGADRSENMRKEEEPGGEVSEEPREESPQRRREWAALLKCC